MSPDSRQFGPTGTGQVFAVQCPNPRCRKFMLVEEQDQNKVVQCLLCKTPIRVGSLPAPGRDFHR